MISLRDFGTALAQERAEKGHSLANLAKNMAVPKEDIVGWENGERAPKKVEIKQLVYCYPRLRRFEQALRAGEYEGAEEKKSEVRLKKAKSNPAPTPPRPPTPPSPPGPREPHHYTPRPIVAVVNPLPPARLSYNPFAEGLRKSRVEMLGDLAKLIRSQAKADDERFDFTIKNDGKHLVVKLMLDEGGEDSVDSGCYIGVGPREPRGLGVFCKAQTNGNFCASIGRIAGVVELLRLAELLHNAVKDRRFDG